MACNDVSITELGISVSVFGTPRVLTSWPLFQWHCTFVVCTQCKMEGSEEYNLQNTVTRGDIKMKVLQSQPENY